MACGFIALVVARLSGFKAGWLLTKVEASYQQVVMTLLASAAIKRYF
jgi:hypothetical protein